MRCLTAVFVVLLFLPLSSAAQESASSADEFNRAVFFGRKFAVMGDHASAVDHYSKAAELRPDDPAVLYNLGVVLARAGRYSDAQVKVDRYLELHPTGAEQPLVAKLQLELEFQRELQKRRQSDQEYADLFNRARFLYGRGELVEALAEFERAARLRPADPAAAFNLGLVFEKQGDFAAAIERFRRYSALETDAEARSEVAERIFTLERELEDTKTKIVCSFCGRKLPAGATWCERCWHGPYDGHSAWNTRSCAAGASATRATYYSDGRFNRNDILACLTPEATLRESLRYSPALQRAIQNARRAEGWTYSGEVLQGWADKQGNQIRFAQGARYLERVTSSPAGDVLTYEAHEGADGVWLLDREDLVIDAQRYTNRYSFDADGRIAQQRVEYQNSAACNHLIAAIGDFSYQDGRLAGVALRGGYEGFAAEGLPKTGWQAKVDYAYDDRGRLSSEELSVTSFTKTYMQKPVGHLRDDIERLYPSLRIKRPLENLARSGDLCASSGSAALSNPVDLRPFYAMSPNLAIAMPNGVTRAVVTFTYPAGEQR
jgi:Tfp pilus assembly protein PilF